MAFWRKNDVLVKQIIKNNYDSQRASAGWRTRLCGVERLVEEEREEFLSLKRTVIRSSPCIYTFYNVDSVM